MGRGCWDFTENQGGVVEGYCQDRFQTLPRDADNSRKFHGRYPRAEDGSKAGGLTRINLSRTYDLPGKDSLGHHLERDSGAHL